MTKWLYNGTELPALPEDVQEYTYIYVTTWQLVYSNEYPIDSLVIDDWPEACISNPHVLDLSSDEESWKVPGFEDGELGIEYFSTDLPIWANFNVLNDDGSIYLEASTPVVPEVETTISDFEYSTIRAQQQGYEIKLARPNVDPWELKANYDISTRSDRIITAQVRYFPKLNDYRLFILGAGNCANKKPWIQEYKDKITYVKIENPVRQIPKAFLSGCTNVSQVVLPLQFDNSLHLLPFTIPEEAFKGCINLSTINISNGTNIIEDRAFEGCNSLLKINLPNAVTSIGQSAFQDSGLRSVVIGRGITNLSENIFKGTNLTDKITIPNNVERINKDAFANISAFPKVFIPASVTEIPDCICDQSDNIQFYCEASKKPEGWNDNWNTIFAAFGLKAPVTWGTSFEDFNQLK